MKGQLSLLESPESLDNSNSPDEGFVELQGYKTTNTYTSFDLFSGCGGLTKGLQMVGVKSIFASDIDENCEKTFARNFGDTPFLCKDITQITKEEVDKLTNNAVPDIIVGGHRAKALVWQTKIATKLKMTLVTNCFMVL